MMVEELSGEGESLKRWWEEGDGLWPTHPASHWPLATVRWPLITGQWPLATAHWPLSLSSIAFSTSFGNCLLIQQFFVPNEWPLDA